jgi:hypothetical protein
MSNTINLLQTTRNHVSPVVERRIRIFRIISVTFLFLVGVVSAGLFLISTFSPLPAIRQQEQDLTAQFQADPLRKKTDSFFLTKMRVEDISRLLTSRAQPMEAYRFFTQFVNGSILLTNLKIDRTGVVFEATSRNLQDIEQMIAAIQKLPEKDKTIKSITISEIEYIGVSGEYSVAISLLTKET